MTPFLKKVASHYLAEGNFGRDCFIFPSRRALVFFKKYLGQCCTELRQPTMVPALYTMNDFIYRIAGVTPTDSIRLISELYSCYRGLNPEAESLDDFIFWGDVLLSDFSDVDKYLVDASQLFTNVTQLKEIEDDFSYLDETQRAAMEKFLHHFKTPGEYKTRFLNIWKILLPLYTSFNEALLSKGMSYEGQAYRIMAENLDSKPVADIMKERFAPSVYDRYIFVGLNALNECEKKLLTKLRDARIGEFCWDYGGQMMTDRHNPASMFLSDFTVRFPSSVDTSSDDAPTEFKVISVPSKTGEAKILPEILKGFCKDGNLAETDASTAIVLPSEDALLTVLNSIPPSIARLNVTMGYPLGGSAFQALIKDVTELQMHIRHKDGATLYYHRNVWGILSNSIIKSLAGEGGSDVIAGLRKDREYYIPREKLAGLGSFADTVFRPLDLDENDTHRCSDICDYLQEVISQITTPLCSIDDMTLEVDFAKQYYLTVGNLRECRLEVKPSTFFKLLERFVSSLSVPFKGEPLNGLQIMGPLETRAVDFENIVILDCNEGVFPKHNVSSSFVPSELRKAFGLPTYERQDAVWAYYFYRLIRRASNVVMVYDSDSSGSRSCEESRYIKQLEMHFRKRTERQIVRSKVPAMSGEQPLVKTESDVSTLLEGRLSASKLGEYLSCPAKFYFGAVCGLSEPEDLSESLDSAGLGSVFHLAMQSLYGGQETITRAWLRKNIGDESLVRREVRRCLLEKTKSPEVAGRDIITEEQIVKYVIKVLRADLDLLENKYKTDSFRIIGIERRVKGAIDGFNFTGIVDRIDSFIDGEVRLIDYKTGKVDDADYTECLDKEGKIRKIPLQLYLYEKFFAKENECRGKALRIGIYATGSLDKAEGTNLSAEFKEQMETSIHSLLREIRDTSVPWERAKGGEHSPCSYCGFKNICGR